MFYTLAFLLLAFVHLQDFDAVYPPSGVGIPAWNLRESNPSILIPQAVVLTCLFGLYLFILVRWERFRFSPVQVLGIGICGGGAAVLALPVNSWDIFANIAYGRISAVHGLNPYFVSYAQIADSYSPYAWYQGPMNYGPVALVPFVIAGLVSELNVLAALYVFKLLGLLTHIGTAWALTHILKRLGQDPGYGVFLFTLNPLLLFELVVNGHNDGLIVLMATIALSALQRGQHAAALLIALLGALVKPPGLLLYAATLTHLVRQRHWRGLAIGTAGSMLAMVALVSLVFGEISAALVLLDRPGNSLYTGILAAIVGGEAVPLEVVLRAGLQLGLIAGLALFCMWRLTRIDTFESVSRETGYMVLAMLVAYQDVIFPWYLAWLFPFAVFFTSSRVRYVVLMYSWTIYGFYISWYLFPPRAGGFGFGILRRVVIHGVLAALLLRRPAWPWVARVVPDRFRLSHPH